MANTDNLPGPESQPSEPPKANKSLRATLQRLGLLPKPGPKPKRALDAPGDDLEDHITNIWAERQTKKRNHEPGQ